MMGPGGPGGMPVGITMHQHQGLGGTAPTHPTHQRPGFGGQASAPPAPSPAPAVSTRGSPGGADVGPPAFFAAATCPAATRSRARSIACRSSPERTRAARRAAARRRRRRTAARAARAARGVRRRASRTAAALRTVPGTFLYPRPTAHPWAAARSPWAAGRAGAGVFGASTGAAREAGKAPKATAAAGKATSPAPVQRRCPSLGSRRKRSDQKYSCRFCVFCSLRAASQAARVSTRGRRSARGVEGRRAPGGERRASHSA